MAESCINYVIRCSPVSWVARYQILWKDLLHISPGNTLLTVIDFSSRKTVKLLQRKLARVLEFTNLRLFSQFLISLYRSMSRLLRETFLIVNKNLLLGLPLRQLKAQNSYQLLTEFFTWSKPGFMIVIWVELVRGDKVRLRPGQWDHWDDLLATGSSRQQKVPSPLCRIIIICTRNNTQTTGQTRMVPRVLLYPSKFSCQQFIKFLPQFTLAKTARRVVKGNWARVEEAAF